MGLLLGKLKTGLGHLIDIALQQVVLTLVCPLVTSSRYNDHSYSRVPDRPPAIGRMETKDGYVILGAEVIRVEGHRRTDLTRRPIPGPVMNQRPICCRSTRDCLLIPSTGTKKHHPEFEPAGRG